MSGDAWKGFHLLEIITLLDIFTPSRYKTGQQVAKIKAEGWGEQEGSDTDSSPSLRSLEEKKKIK